MLAAADDDGFRSVAAGPLRGSAVLTLMTAGAIGEVGLELRPTFRRPHFTVILVSLDDGIRRLRSCENEVIENPHYDQR